MTAVPGIAGSASAPSGSSPAYVPLHYPGPGFRPVPSFSLAMPPNWVVSEFPGALFVMGFASPADGLWTNVIVRHCRIPRGTTLEDVAREDMHAVAENIPDAVIRSELLASFETIHYVREIAFADPDASPHGVARIDSFFFYPTIETITTDLFQITWLSPDVNPAEIKSRCMSMLSTIRFD